MAKAVFLRKLFVLGIFSVTLLVNISGSEVGYGFTVGKLVSTSWQSVNKDEMHPTIQL